MGINVISRPAVTTSAVDTTDSGKKTVTSLTQKTASSGEIALLAADVSSGLVVCSEAKQVFVTLNSSASDFISALGAEAGDVVRCWIINTDAGIINLDARRATGFTVFGDTNTLTSGCLELQFIVIGSNKCVLTSTAHNPQKG